MALTAAALATKTLRVGTGICLLPEHDPIVTAKAIASLDLLSDGRVDVGIGAGWNAEEMENHGTEFATRFRVMSERAKAMKTLWAEQEPAFHGEFTDFDPVWSFPKPVQKPNPPLLVGGESIHTLRRVVDYADGWLPRARGGFDPSEGVSRLRAVADAAGRDTSTLTINVFGAPSDATVLDLYREAGIDRAILSVPSDAADVVLPHLDRHARHLP